MTRFFTAALLLGLLGALAGCSSGPRYTYDQSGLPPTPDRNPELARRLNAEALALMDKGELDKAVDALNRALTADVFCGPAHNNLGTLHLKRQQFYQAAWEFQYAAKLMPGTAQPRYNLGMVYERVGKLEDASQWYEKALAVQPESAAILGNLARTRIRQGKHDDRTRQLLEQLVLVETRPAWRQWAEGQLNRWPERPDPSVIQPAAP